MHYWGSLEICGNIAVNERLKKAHKGRKDLIEMKDCLALSNSKELKNKQGVAFASPSLCTARQMYWLFLIPNSPLFCSCHSCWHPFALAIKLNFKDALTALAQAAMHAYISSVSDSWLYQQEFQGGNERSECIHFWDGSRIMSLKQVN